MHTGCVLVLVFSWGMKKIFFGAEDGKGPRRSILSTPDCQARNQEHDEWGQHLHAHVCVCLRVRMCACVYVGPWAWVCVCACLCVCARACVCPCGAVREGFTLPNDDKCSSVTSTCPELIPWEIRVCRSTQEPHVVSGLLFFFFLLSFTLYSWLHRHKALGKDCFIF